MSGQLKIECKNTTDPSYPYLTQNCTYSFPHNESTLGAANITIEWQYEESYIHNAIYQNISVTVDQEKPVLAQVESLKIPRTSYQANESSWAALEEYVTPVALQCQLTLCKQTHGATSYDAGTLHDATTSSKDLTYNPNFNDLNSLCQNDRADDLLNFLCPGWPTDQSRPPVAAMNVSHWAVDEDVYWLNPSNVYSVQWALQQTLQMSFDPDQKKLTHFVSPLQQQLLLGELPEVLDDVAASLTNKIRQLNSTRSVDGHVRDTVTFVHVNWYWLIYPAALAILAALFLVISVVFSFERSGVVWKSAVLPLLFHPLEGIEKSSDAIRLRDIERDSRDVRMCLTEKDGMPHLMTA